MMKETMKKIVAMEKEDALELLKDDAIYGGIVKAVSLARQLAEKNSTCARRQIGCVLLGRDGLRLFEIGTGWNGVPYALENCRYHKTCPDADIPAGQGAYGKVRCWGMHAEHMAIIDAWDRVSLYGGHPPSRVWACVCTKAPCTTCTSMLMATGCKVIVYEDEPNDKDAELFFPYVRMSFKQVRNHFHGVG